jgi:hypothetical protein
MPFDETSKGGQLESAITSRDREDVGYSLQLTPDHPFEVTGPGRGER